MGIEIQNEIEQRNIAKEGLAMKAAVLEKFGGPEELHLKEVPMPELGDHEVLVQVAYAGVGQWDIFEREGGYAEMLGTNSTFPYILGSEGAGYVHAVGKAVENRHIGERVCAVGFLNPKGGFYAEYVAVDATRVFPVPESWTLAQASVISGIGLTALRGLEDILQLSPGESVLILGASGGVGHVAVQLAKQMGARIFAIASQEDGVAMVSGLGVDKVVGGRSGAVLKAAKAFAPDGFDAALLTAGGEIASSLVECVRDGGRVAYPNGIYPIPEATHLVDVIGYHGEPEQEILKRLYQRLNTGGIDVHIAGVFPLMEARQAHEALQGHYLGKLCLKVSSDA